MIQMPEPLNLGAARQMTIGNLLNQQKIVEEEPHAVPEADRYVMGYPLPSWQRQFKWTESQCIRFLESAWLCLPIGVYVVNSLDWTSDGKPRPLSGLLIDGQQRLRALEQYFQNEFQVFNAYWKDLPSADRRKFLNRTFPSYELSVWEERELRDLYNRLNFGGTPHLREEMA